MPMLYQALQNAGFHEDDIEKIFYKKCARVYKKCSFINKNQELSPW